MPVPADPSVLAALIEQLCDLAGCVPVVRDAVVVDAAPEGIHPDDLPIHRAAVAAGGGGAYRVGYRRADGAGGWRRSVEQARPVQVDGRVLWVGAEMDVGERDEGERARRRYEAIVESQAEWIVRQSPDGRNTFVNEAYCRYKGATREQLTAPDYPHFHTVEPESLERFAKNRAALGPDRPAATTEMRVRHRDGSARWHVWTDMAITDEAGRVVEYQCVGREITEQKRAELALRESGELYRGVVEAQTDLIVRIRPDGRATFVNDAYCRHMGMTREQLLDLSWDDLSMLAPEERARVEEEWAGLTPEAPTSTHECAVLLPDGRRAAELWSQRGIFDADGRLVEVQGVGRDVTEQRRTERALRESEARLAAFMEHAPVGMYLKDLGGRYLMLNPEMEKVLGRPVAGMVGRDPAEVFGPGEVAAIRAFDREIVETGLPTRHEEHLPGLAAYAWSMVIRFPVRDAAGVVTHVGGFDLDITAQRRALAELEESEQRFRRFAEAHPVPLSSLRTADWGVLFANPAYLDLFQLTADELNAADKRTQWADPEKRAPHYERLRREGRVDNNEVTLRRKDGTTFPAHLSSRLMDFGGVEATVNTVVDLSRQKAAEAEIERQRDALHQSEKLGALGSMLAGVAHELNNPLSVVVGYAALLREDARTRKAREQAERIHVAAQRCARIVKTFLALARQKPPSFGPVDLVGTVDAALELAAYGLRTSGVRVTTALPAELAPVHGDADQLHQVVANLVINAKQALQDVPGPRRLEIEVAAAADGGEVRLTVADNGPGIPAEVLRRVFEPFFTTKPAGVGTGLGLAVCHGIVTAHGGRIEVQSREGQGTRVEVALPTTAPSAVAEPSGAPPRATAPDRAPSREGGRRARILVVDDETDIARLVGQTLAGDGHRVDQVADGEAALARIGRGGIDLVISDLRMPGMDGAALLRALRATHPGLARSALILTGDLLSAAAVPELREEAVGLLEKPIDPDELRRAVRSRLASLEPR